MPNFAVTKNVKKDEKSYFNSCVVNFPYVRPIHNRFHILCRIRLQS